MAGLIGPLKTSLVARVSMHEGGTAWGNKRTAGEAGKQLLFQFRPLSVVVVDSSFRFSTALPPSPRSSSLTARVGGRAWPMDGWRMQLAHRDRAGKVHEYGPPASEMRAISQVDSVPRFRRFTQAGGVWSRSADC